MISKIIKDARKKQTRMTKLLVKKSTVNPKFIQGRGLISLFHSLAQRPVSYGENQGIAFEC